MNGGGDEVVARVDAKKGQKTWNVKKLQTLMAQQL